jgi:5-hydroxyisourate hydrolase
MVWTVHKCFGANRLNLNFPMSPITTHILDTRLGRPAAGVGVYLERLDAAGAWQLIGSGATDQDGRLAKLLGPGELPAGRYRLTFETGAYFQAQQVEYFYPRVAVEFEVAAPGQHHHVPLLLSPFGYSTYRGS